MTKTVVGLFDTAPEAQSVVQELIKVTKQDDGVLKQESLGAVRFVALIGEEGWDG